MQNYLILTGNNKLLKITFMKVLLLCSGKSSISNILKQALSHISNDVDIINYLDFLPQISHRILDKSGKMPGIIEKRMRNYYLHQIQLKYIQVFNTKKPDLILIYNDQMLWPETLDKIMKDTKVGIYLADSPLFLQKRAHIIGLIRRADVVFAPDTYWLEQCKMLGVKKAEYLIPGYNPEHNFKMLPTRSQTNEFGSDVFFMGSPYKDNWGYKRALFLSKFCNLNFLFIGPACWNEWFVQFPELKLKWKLKKGYLKDEELNIMMNCTKIIPVDANPGIINGCHIRVFDAIAAGVLPLVEYRKDLDTIFKDTGLPFVKNYNEIPEITRYLIDDNTERSSLIEILQKYILIKYSTKKSAEIIYSALTF